MKISVNISEVIGKGIVKSHLNRAIEKVKDCFRPSILSRLSHPIFWYQRLPVVDFEIKELDTIKQSDVEIAIRIIKAYEFATRKEPVLSSDFSNKDVWDDIENHYHKVLIDIIAQNNPYKLAEYLNSMHLQGATYGISDINENHFKELSPRSKKEYLLTIKDILVCLGESLGAITYKRSSIDLYNDTNKIFEEIKKKVKFSINIPNLDSGIVKSKAGETSFSPRDLYSIYTACRVSQIISDEENVAEIGAGLGKTAFFCFKFGIKNYYIFDLPQLNVIQAWYLIKNGQTVSLYGEEVTKDSVKVYPWWEFNNNSSYTLTLNVDSFAEMSENIVNNYLTLIKKNTKKYLLSINHEKEYVDDKYELTPKRIVVSWLLEKDTNFKKIYRFPFWVRRGYLEELYSIVTEST